MYTTVTDSIEQLEFDYVPTCEMSDIDPQQQCGKTAAWYGVSPCCGNQTYACVDHHRVGWVLQCCKCWGHVYSSQFIWTQL